MSQLLGPPSAEPPVSMASWGAIAARLSFRAADTASPQTGIIYLLLKLGF